MRNAQHLGIFHVLQTVASAACFALLSMPSCIGAAEQTDGARDRAWTIEDSIAVKYFVPNTGDLSWIPVKIDPVTWSPGRRRFFVVTRSGDLSRDATASELKVFDAKAIKRFLLKGDQNQKAPGPITAITMHSTSSSSFMQGISSPQWVDDESLTFIGVRENGPRQVYRLHVDSGRLEQLTNVDPYIGATTNESLGVLRYAATADSLVYVAPTSSRPKKDLERYPMVEPLKSSALLQLTTPSHATTNSLFGIYQRGDARLIGSFASAIPNGPWLSPNGRWAVIAGELHDDTVASSPRAGDRLVQRRFTLIDLRHATHRPMLNAPIGPANIVIETPTGHSNMGVLWSQDSSQVILVNTSLPTEQTDTNASGAGYLIAYSVQTGKWEVLEPMISDENYITEFDVVRDKWVLRPKNSRHSHAEPKVIAQLRRVSAVRWAANGAELIVDHASADGESSASTVYSFQQGTWRTRKSVVHNGKAKTHSPLGHDVLSISLRESANDPPALVASILEKEVTLIPPDSALTGVWRAPVQHVEWRESDGRVVSGGLMMPRDRGEGPVPVVIQAYHYLPQLFRPDGPYPTAYAAQPLVSRGMAVLQLDIPTLDRPEVSGTPLEGKAFVDRIDSAIEALSGKYHLDPTRVGLVGFSRGAFLTFYAVTHPGRIRLAAAVIADGFTGGFGEYVTTKALRERDTIVTQTLQGVNGGAFWSRKEAWLEHAPSFNIDRVQTPSLFAFNNKQSLWQALEIVGAFRLNNRPLELICFPEGEHQLQRPRERFASMDATVDWMSFWLLGEQHSGSGKADRYERWQGMRAQQKAVLAALKAQGQKVAPLPELRFVTTDHL